jgi:hypothetical protein
MSAAPMMWAFETPIKRPLDRLWLIILAEWSCPPDEETGEWPWCTFGESNLERCFGQKRLTNDLLASLNRLIRAGKINAESLGETTPGVRVRFAKGSGVFW